ncbi:hypothetical protein Tco_0884001 [Tanacetum coccineum]
MINGNSVLIDDFDLRLTPVMRPSSSTRVETSPSTQNSVRIISGPAGIVQAAKLLKQKDMLLGLDEAVTSTQEYMNKVIEDVGKDDDFKSGSWVSATHYVNANGGTVSGYNTWNNTSQVIGEGGYGKDITVGAALILVFRKDTIPGSGSG